MPPIMIARSRLWMRWLLLVMFLLLAGGCRVVESVPKADIVFQTMAIDMGSPYELGFVNADGTGLAYVKPRSLPGGMPIVPVQTFNAAYLAFLGQHTDSAFTMGLVSAITKDGYLKKHDFYARRIAPVPGKQQVIMDEYTGGKKEDILSTLVLFDLETDAVVETYRVGDDTRHPSIGANALSGSKLVFVRYSDQLPLELVLFDTQTKIEKTVLVRNKTTDGSSPLLYYPSISPDGRWIAYTAEDGIYIVDVEGKAAKRVVDICVREYITGSLRVDEWPSAPSWSPDSQWIVYHRCRQPCPIPCDDTGMYAIYKLSVNTGEETFLVSGGVNPYWRLSPRTKN